MWKGTTVRFGRKNPVGEDGLTNHQRRAAETWSYLLAEVSKLAPLVERGDLETLAWQADGLASRAQQLVQWAKVGEREISPDPGAMLAAMDQDVLDTPIGQALHRL